MSQNQELKAITKLNWLKGLSHEKEQGSDAISIDRSPFKDVSAGLRY